MVWSQREAFERKSVVDPDRPTGAASQRGGATCDELWLLTADAQPWLELARSVPEPLELGRRLRDGGLDAGRAALVSQLAELRRRAVAKFRHAERMFFTRRGLEQSTDEVIAAYKSRMFPDGAPVADLCCGIGGDSLAVARKSPVVAVDIDPVMAGMAGAHLDQWGCSTSRAVAGSAEEVPLGDFEAWHIDPDRRPGGRRVVSMESMNPSGASIASMLRAAPHAAIKVAPATPALGWPIEARREWIGHGGQCQQQVIWTGRFADGPERRATVLRTLDGWASSIDGTGAERAEQVASCAEYVHEPHAAVLAAGLVGALAQRHRLATFTDDRAYLTGGGEVRDPLVASYRVIDVMPFRVSEIKRYLASRSMKVTQIKRRGVVFELESLQRQLSARPGSPCTLIVARSRRRALAIVATPP